MKPTRALKLVADEPVDITLALRAEIEARDWARCHIEGDRRAPVQIDEPRKGWWRG